MGIQRRAKNPPPSTFQVSTAEAADVSLVIGEGLSCADPGNGSLTGDVSVAATGVEGVWGATVVSGVAMKKGTHSLKLCVGGGVGINVDSIKFDLVSERSAQAGVAFRAVSGFRLACVCCCCRPAAGGKDVHEMWLFGGGKCRASVGHSRLANKNWQAPRVRNVHLLQELGIRIAANT